MSHIRQVHGNACLAAILQRAGAPTQAGFSQRIRKLEGYPYAAYGRFLQAADDELGSGDLALCTQLGEETSRRDLSSVFAFFTRLYGPERLARACARVWAQYYRNAGSMEAIAWRPQETIVRISGFSGMHPAHCKLMEGWMWAAMKTVGARVEEGYESSCTSRGDANHEFFWTWTT